MTIGDKIKQLRTEREWSQEQVARMLGYKSRSTINKIELGINELTQSKIVAFANLFGVEPWQLLNDEPLNMDEIKSRWARTDRERMIQAEVKVYEDVQAIFGKIAFDLLSSFNQLNKLGQEKALAQIQDMAEISKYRKDDEQ
jgi:transcriptional regulator with XRE-family HTH domain